MMDASASNNCDPVESASMPVTQKNRHAAVLCDSRRFWGGDIFLLEKLCWMLTVKQ